MKFNFEKLEVWQLSKSLCIDIFNLTKEFPNDEKYILISQMRRSALSIPSNLAEGSARQSTKDKSHFYSMAYGSLMELINHCIIAKEFDYLTDNQLNEVKEKSIIIAKMISKLKSNTK